MFLVAVIDCIYSLINLYFISSSPTLSELLTSPKVKVILSSSIRGASEYQMLLFSHSVQLFAIPRTAAHQASLSTLSQSLLKLMFIESVMPYSHLVLCRPLLLLPSVFPGSFPMSQFFASGGQSIGASVSVSPSNEYSGLISFRTDWFDLLAVQGTPKSLL